jgi:hypothetical protein
MKYRLLERTTVTSWNENHGSKKYPNMVQVQNEEIEKVLQMCINDEWVDVPVEYETVYVNN